VVTDVTDVGTDATDVGRVGFAASHGRRRGFAWQGPLAGFSATAASLARWRVGRFSSRRRGISKSSLLASSTGAMATGRGRFLQPAAAVLVGLL